MSMTLCEVPPLFTYIAEHSDRAGKVSDCGRNGCYFEAHRLRVTVLRRFSQTL